MTEQKKVGLPSNVRIETCNAACGTSYTNFFVDAPFFPEQVRSLNAYQTAGQGHPFTCGRDRSDDPHREYQRVHGGHLGQLLATEAGWVCPVLGCNYVQGWAWLRMCDWSWRHPDEPLIVEPDHVESESN